MDNKPDNTETPSARAYVFLLGAIVLLIVAIVYVLNNLGTVTNTLTNAPQETPNSSAPPLLKYGFEKGPMGWVAQTFENSQAVTKVKQVSEPAKFGNSSLELEVDLIGPDPHKSSGEAFVDFTNFPPAGETIPIDLNGKPIIMWVYVPPDAIGDPGVPNALQVFVKDSLDRSQYANWVKLTTVPTNEWITISMTPSDQPAEGYKTDPGFDPTHINILGLKIGSEDESQSSFTGSIWIGGVYWP
jgi:hypothetical protein